MTPVPYYSKIRGSKKGNTSGYTQFAAASADGRRSVTVSINAQHTPKSGSPVVFEALRRAEVKAVCAALAD
jgi:D-alanyl-D-alanine carboxypeptidase